MKMLHSLIVLMLMAVGLLTGCQSPGADAPSKTVAAQTTRNNGYSLLHQLLEEQKDVSLLRFIRPEHNDVKQLVKKIAKTSGAGGELIEAFAKDDPSINLNDIGLPPGELATRDAIGAAKKKELLSQSGDTFELTLLLTQTEALSYGWHLAEVTAANEPEPQRAHALASIGEDMRSLYHQVFTLLLSKMESPSTNAIGTHPAVATTNVPSASPILMIDPSSMPVGGGKATLIIGKLQRTNDVYSGDYQIKVSPYFFKNEKGRLAIIVSDAVLAGINRGKVQAIVGSATTSGTGGRTRHIDATATPADANHGSLKLWFMAGNRKMTFEPAYHLIGNGKSTVLAETITP
jgi:hypothetical protein